MFLEYLGAYSPCELLTLKNDKLAIVFFSVEKMERIGRKELCFQIKMHFASNSDVTKMKHPVRVQTIQLAAYGNSLNVLFFW